MKIRSGFVSNSSSSSFIVAFPKEPKSERDVLDMMFNGDEQGVIPPLWSGGEGLLMKKVAQRVFSDLKNSKPTRSELLSNFSGRYFILDDHLYYHNLDDYYRLNEPLCQQLIDLHRKYRSECESHDLHIKNILHKYGIMEVPYAYENGTNWHTKKLYTNEEIKSYEKYEKLRSSFIKTNAEYLAAEKSHRKFCRKYAIESAKIINKLASLDLAKFKKDTKGKYIATFTYSDNDGKDGALMEHGNIFYNLKHIQFSHH